MGETGIGNMQMSVNSDQYARLTDLAQLEVNPNGEQAMTYVVDSIVDTYTSLDRTIIDKELRIKIAGNITLVFKDGQIVVPDPYTSLTLEGTQTVLQASMVQIFGAKVEAVGTWDIEQAYPQWFDEMAGKDANDSSDLHDCSSAINKAAKMKMVGEVFLPVGKYFISNPITLPIGIKLIGEGLSATKIHENKKETVKKDGEEKEGIKEYVRDIIQGTFIIPFLKKTKDWPGRAFVEINLKDEPADQDWAVPYPKPFGMMSDIFFCNKRKRPENFPISKKDESETLSRIPCCYVAGAYTFQNLIFQGFRRCIKWSNNCYSDHKYIWNCGFFNDANYLSEEMGDDVCYAIDAGYLGEALVIERCHAIGHSLNDDKTKIIKFFHALKVSECKGGSVVNNIFNCDVHFFWCLGMTYEGNHMEDGAQVVLSGCDIAVRNNYFDKIMVPSIVVSMGNPSKPQEKYEQSKDSNLEISGNIFMVDLRLKKGKERFPASYLCEYDVGLDKTGDAPYTIHLSQNYRYANFGNRCNQPTGIMLCTFPKETYTVEDKYDAFKDFNDHSYYLSTESYILPNLQIRAKCVFEDLPTLFTENKMGTTIRVFQTGAILNSCRNNQKDSATNGGWQCHYKARLFMDDGRGLQTGLFGVNLPMDENENIIKYDPKYGQTFEISYSPKKSCCILRLYRYKVSYDANNEQKLSFNAFVDVPVIGTLYLYDNNYSVNGYVWNELGNEPDSKTFINASGQWLGFKNYNVRYFLKDSALPDVSKWKEHDEVITPAGEIYFLLGGEWVKLNN